MAGTSSKKYTVLIKRKYQIIHKNLSVRYVHALNIHKTKFITI